MKATVIGIDAVIAEIAAKAKKTKAQVERDVANEAVKRLKEATPVDTGRARDGWKVDENNNIVNDVEYIEDLNNGHSQQAASHFIESTLLSVPGVRPNGFIVTHKE